MTFRGAVRQAAYAMVEGGGINLLVGATAWRGRRLLVLCYHGFSMADEDRWNPTLYMRPDTFRRRLGLLRRRGCTVVTLADGLAMLTERRLPPRAVAITVDDGSKNFLAAGYPVLRDLGVPVTLYVSTYYVRKRLPVFNGCASYILWRGAEAGATLSRQPWLERPLALGGEAAWQGAFRTLLAWCEARGLDAGGKQSLLEGLAAETGVDLADLVSREQFHLMSLDDLASLDPALVDLQLHTHRHTMPADAALLERELQDNREVLARSGRPAESLVHFCYPSGVYHRDLLPALGRLGIRSATTCVPGLATPASDPLLLPRFIDNEAVSEAAFLAWLSGTGDLLRPRRGE